MGISLQWRHTDKLINELIAFIERPQCMISCLDAFDKCLPRISALWKESYGLA